MYNACAELYPSMNAGILCAAVADFTPHNVADHKIKREGEDMILRLKPTKDIAAELGKTKRKDQLLVGFALETNDETTNAHLKLAKKNFDFIVLNSLNDKGAGFRTDTNKISIITAKQQIDFPLKSKKEVAHDIINQLVALS
jgi:phosphopantothenoylcysteine decarboxylase/phosphopantothenate--cysteine ligase